MSNKQHHIAIVLDETGSMMSLKDATINGFNEFIDKLHSEPGKPRITLVRFNSTAIKVDYKAKKLSRVEKLTSETYNPDAMTPLHDAIGQTIRVMKVLMSDKDTALVMIITDGQENASTEYDLADIKALIKDCEATKNWTFTYLGANVNAFAEGGKLGIAHGNIANYTPDIVGVNIAYRRMAKATSRSMAAGGINVDYLMADDEDEPKYKS